MGNTENPASGQSADFFGKYQQLRKERSGTVLSDSSGENHFFLKELNFADKQEYQRQLSQYQQMKKSPSENLLSLLQVEGRQLNNFCSNSYKIYALYQYPIITLQEQIIARSKENKYFEECELWSILQSCTNALSEVKPALALNPDNIFIVPDGVLKVVSNDMISEDHRCLLLENIYYAPEKMKNFHKSDNEHSLRKQAIFSMGMTLLNAALLKPIYNCYDLQKYTFEQKILQGHLQRLGSSRLEQEGQSYSEQFVQVLSMIVEPNPNKRASLMEVHGLLNKVWKSESDADQKQTVEEEPNHHEYKEIEQNENKNIKIETNQPLIIETKSQRTSINPSERHSRPFLDYPQTVCHSNTASFCNFNFNKENLYTDPKLLEMIRKDLHDLNQLKRSSVLRPYESSISYTGGYYGGFASRYTEMSRYDQPLQANAFSKENRFQSSRKQFLEEQKPQGHFFREQDDEGRVFQGFLVNGVKQGHGKLTYSDGAYYEGDFNDDKMHGKGTLYYGPGRPAYSGGWENDQFHGWGKLFNQNPVKLEGQFNYNDFNLIQEFWIQYEGNFSFDNKSGQGKLYLSNGEEFHGHFSNDFITGRGKFVTKMGEEVRGIWQENMLVQMDA